VETSVDKSQAESYYKFRRFVMAKDEKNPRIEGIFGQIGLGNQDPEKLEEFLDDYERTMAMAERLRNKKKTNFEEVLQTAAENPPGEETES
jgi:hypothetical protein